MQNLISKDSKIAVLCGGMSSEKEVSLRSGKNVYDALKRLYDKMVTSYGTILEITHNPALVEWHKHFITIKNYC